MLTICLKIWFIVKNKQEPIRMTEMALTLKSTLTLCYPYGDKSWVVCYTVFDSKHIQYYQLPVVEVNWIKNPYACYTIRDKYLYTGGADSVVEMGHLQRY
jgi:hypothetical protein